MYEIKRNTHSLTGSLKGADIVYDGQKEKMIRIAQENIRDLEEKLKEEQQKLQMAVDAITDLKAEIKKSKEGFKQFIQQVYQ